MRATLTGVIDENDGGVDTPGTDLTGGVYDTATDVNGRGTITLADGQTIAFYMISAGALRIVEIDDFVVGGSAYTAASASGFDTTALTGSFVFTDNGQIRRFRWTDCTRRSVHYRRRRKHYRRR